MDFTKEQKLVLVKSMHTAVWVFFNLVLAYLFYAVCINNVGPLFWIGVGLILVECFVLLINGWVCPLTPVARRYTDIQAANFDIYLPEWLAKHNKTIYTAMCVFLVILYFMK